MWFRADVGVERPSRTRIYIDLSYEDDVVDWRSCVDEGGSNFQVRGKHVGLTVNREVYRLIAEILARRANLPAIGDSSGAAM